MADGQEQAALGVQHLLDVGGHGVDGGGQFTQFIRALGFVHGNRLGKIAAPFLHVTAEHDHIVTTGASAPLIGLIGSQDKEQVVLKGGHVSLIAGPNAVKRMWPRLDAWLAEKSV